MSNPFNPGAGRKPPYLAGRDDIVRSIEQDMTRVYDDAEGMRPIVISGLRGMGKTVLLRALYDFANQRGWVVVWAEASKDESLSKKLAQSIYVELRKLRSSEKLAGRAFEHALAVLKSFQLKIDPAGACSFGIDVSPAKGYADSGDLSLDLQDLLEALGGAAREAGTAMLICVDELQEAPIEDLRPLNMALHSIGQSFSPVPVFFVGAGLPTLPSVLADASSYAERLYRYYTLDPLSDKSSGKALVEPVAGQGMAWSPEALGLVVQEAAGYPYFIQQCGFSICEQVDGPIELTMVETLAGIELAREELSRGLYRSRWGRATAQGKEFMRAMAQDEGPSKISEIARRMGKGDPSSLSVLRDRLIKDGLIYSPERGLVAFTVPGMDGFINRCGEVD